MAGGWLSERRLEFRCSSRNLGDSQLAENFKEVIRFVSVIGIEGAN